MAFVESTSLFAFFIVLFLCAFIILRGRRLWLHIIYALFLLSIAIWALGIFGLIKSIDKSEAWIWMRVLNLGFVFIPILFLNSTLLLIEKSQKRLLKTGYILTFLFFLPVSFTPLFTKDVVRLNYFYVASPGVLFPLFLIFLVSLWIYGFILLYQEYRISKGNNRNKIAHVLAASIIVLVGGLMVLPSLMGFSIYPIWNITNIIYGVMIAYAITKVRLMDISVIISRAMAWALTVLFLGAIYTAFVLHYRTYISSRIDLPFFIFSFIYGVFVGESFQKIRFFLQTTTDRAFIKNWYDYRRVLRDAAAGLGRALTREDITKVLYPVFQNDIDAAEAHLLFHDNKTDDYIELREGGAEQAKILILGKDAAPIKLLLNNKDKIIHEGKAYIPSFHENNLIALMILGKKRSEDEYSEDDYELFRTISEYVAIVLEYIVKPYEEVKEKFEETERKLVETEKQLERSQRLASLATMAAGVAHEIRNPLGIIHSKTEKLDDAPRDIEYLRAFKESVLKNSKRISSIITSMLDLTKAGEKKMEKVNLNEIIESTFQLLTFNDIKLEKKYENIPGITGDPEELKRIFINLFSNAIEAMTSTSPSISKISGSRDSVESPGGGYLTVSTYLIEEDDIKKVCVDISDTGRGIAKENLVKIFDPFFSGRHEGVGLGLSIVYRVVREHGGEISVKSEIGKGSTFSLKFNAVPS